MGRVEGALDVVFWDQRCLLGIRQAAMEKDVAVDWERFENT